MAPTSSDFMLAMFLLNEIVPSAIAWPSVPVSLFGDQFAVNDGMGPLETWSFLGVPQFCRDSDMFCNIP